MVLDECIETPAPRDKAEAALVRTTAVGETGAGIFSWRMKMRYERKEAVAIRNCAGRHVCGFATGERAAVAGTGFSRVCGGRAGGRRAARDDVRNDRRSDGAAAGRPAAISDGSGKAGTAGRLRGAGHRHDGLRVAHARGAARVFVHQRRAGADQECAVCGRPAANRSAVHVAAFANATRARICGIFLRREKSPRRFWRPTTMSTFTLTSCGKSVRLSSLGI